MANVSRHSVRAALVQDRWVVVIADQEGIGTPQAGASVAASTSRTVRDFHHRLNMHLKADEANTDNVTVIVQESNDAITWVTVNTFGPIVPGGELEFNAVHSREMFRVGVYSVGSGFVSGDLLQPELQASPGYLINPALTCSTWCQVDCETAAEGYGDVPVV